MFCMAMQPELRSFQDNFERQGVEYFVYMDGVSLGHIKFTAKYGLS